MTSDQIDILYLVEGAQKAKGLVVVIDVFRAFSLESYLYDKGVSSIQIVDSIDEAYKLKENNKELLLVGERAGKKCSGFDYGNSPASIDAECIKGRKIIHTTSQGTRGIIAVNKKEVLAASLVNAAATARYILKENPQKVSLVCMGNSTMRAAEEDILCAYYIKSLITSERINNFKEQLYNLKNGSGKKFFQAETQDLFPEKDFWMCIDYDRFDFILLAKKEEQGVFVHRKFI